MRALGKRVTQELHRCLIALGTHYTGRVWQPAPTPDQQQSEPDGPSAGHPERLCPGMALTPLERAIEQELNRRS
ncbi:hypothetical protein AA958_30225 [Streptomyces sp. CNQ-509]|uniref:DUF6059 family protein n=1 Tax=Streptomyces sp. CNQ-509 TaxID=444103 RepID=UPI00062DF3F0|nr:hypothetical protein AA958_30225 [Streptomyces sp. CNQ-509]